MKIRVLKEQLAEFCRKNHIRKLALFGSVSSERPPDVSARSRGSSTAKKVPENPNPRFRMDDDLWT
ncbi:MAG: hypothetical protein ACREMY_34265 [bacterium]